MLSLAEEIFLLSLLEKKDTIRIPNVLSLPYALAGAVLFDLITVGYAKLEDGRVIPCAEQDHITDGPLKYALEKIHQADKPRKLNHWVYLLGSKGKRISKSIVLAFVERGILTRTGKAYQWAPAQKDGEPQQAPSKYILKRALRDTMFVEQTISVHCIALFELMDACDMLDHLFTKDEIVAVRKKMSRWVSDESTSPDGIGLVQQIREATQYAITSAMMR